MTLVIAVALTTLTAFHILQVNEKLVFTTTSFKSAKTIKLDGILYSLTVKKKCNEVTDPPYECWTNIRFTPDTYSDLKVCGDAYSFASADINQDGVDEIIVLSAEGGNWRQVSVFSTSDKTKSFWPAWYQPIEGFMYYPGSEGDNMCPANIFWLSDKKQVKVLTTDASTEDFKCKDQKIFTWKTK